MIVAQLRGVQFVSCSTTRNGAWEPADRRAFLALEDVAEDLRYRNPYDYNHACRTNPDEVRKRLAAL